MEVYSCDCSADVVLFLDNRQCLSCGKVVGFDPRSLNLQPLFPAGDGLWRSAGGETYRFCQNHARLDACNWLVPSNSPHAFCGSCRLNEVIPDLDVDSHLPLWRTMEQAKRRCLITLARLALPLVAMIGGQTVPLRFRFLVDATAESHFREPLTREKVLTGHQSGMITINLAEADVVARHEQREALGESYRTLLGHFRHEVGHYYWDVLVANYPDRLQSFRELFGDEREEYGQALETHYRQGHPARAASSPEYISYYAASHPWEDWAETWAHVLHMLDTLETAGSYGIAVKELDTDLQNLDPFLIRSAPDLLRRWKALTLALNGLNRSLGMDDPYPFVLTSQVEAKISFILTLLWQQIDAGATNPFYGG